MYKSISFIISLLLLGGIAKAQQDLTPGLKAWGSFGITMRTSKTASLRFSRLQAFDTNPTQLQFTQTGLEYSKRAGKHWKAYLGYTYSFFPNTNAETNTYHRGYAAIRHKFSISDRVSMSNMIRAEYHTPAVRKFQSRFIYTNKITVKTDLPWNMTPYLRNQLYYYQSGTGRELRSVSDTFIDPETGEAEIEPRLVIPNGFHRWRGTLGVRMEPSNNFYVTLYATMQKEFNTPWSKPENQLNVADGTRTRLRYNHYNVIGVSLSYTFKAYRKKTRKKK